VDVQESERPLFQTQPQDKNRAAENVHRNGLKAAKAYDYFGRKRPPEIEEAIYFNIPRIVVPRRYRRKTTLPIASTASTP
jgi:hypothetical protein